METSFIDYVIRFFLDGTNQNSGRDAILTNVNREHVAKCALWQAVRLVPYWFVIEVPRASIHIWHHASLFTFGNVACRLGLINDNWFSGLNVSAVFPFLQVLFILGEINCKT